MEADTAAAFIYFDHQNSCLFVVKTALDLTIAWSTKTCFSSTNTEGKYLTKDPSEQTLYLASDYQDTHFFICKVQASDGSMPYCASLDGDAADYPFYLKVIGNYLLVQGSSESSEFKRIGDQWGHFVLWINKDL